MAQCGSKGSPLNISQMIACLGQQSVGGSRIQGENSMINGRKKSEVSPQSFWEVEINEWTNTISSPQFYLALPLSIIPLFIVTVSDSNNTVLSFFPHITFFLSLLFTSIFSSPLFSCPFNEPHRELTSLSLQILPLFFNYFFSFVFFTVRRVRGSDFTSLSSGCALPSSERFRGELLPLRLVWICETVVLYYRVEDRSVLSDAFLHSTSMSCTILYFTIPYYNSFFYATLYCVYCTMIFHTTSKLYYTIFNLFSYQNNCSVHL